MNDFHCHLDLYPRPLEVFAAAVSRNDFTLLVTTSPRAFIATSRAVPSHPKIAIAPGLHPEMAFQKQGELGLLLAQIKSSGFVGEIGLDGSAKHKAHWKLQCELFVAAIAACSQVKGRVISIHSRKAATKVLDVLEQHGEHCAPILHWFSGSAAELRRAIALDCWFSVGPAMLASTNGRNLAKEMPPQRVVSETDGPFARVGGEPLFPWDVASVPSALARLWGMPPTEVAHQLDANATTVCNVAAAFARFSGATTAASGR